MLNGAGMVLMALATWGQALPSPMPSPEPRYYLIQVRIIEVDDQGKQTVVATPSLQTTGNATGVTIDPKRGRKFEFHFNAIDPSTPTARPKATADAGPSPLQFADGSKIDRPAVSLVSVKAIQQSRKEVLKTIADQAGLQLVLDADTAAATAAPLLTPISLELQDTPVEEAIRQIIEPAKLNFALRQDLVLIGASPIRATAPLATAAMKGVSGPVLIPPSPLPNSAGGSPAKPIEDSNALSVRVYAVQDLVEVEAATQRPQFKPLIEKLQKIAAGETWDVQGGTATISGFDSTISLVVRQTAAGHEAMAKMLAELRATTTGSQPTP